MSEFMMNGLDIPAPVKWSVVDQPVTTAYSGKQTLDGKLHNSVIRHRRVITCQYGFLGIDEVSLLRDLLKGNKVLLRFPEANDLGFDEAYFIPAQQTRPLKIVKDGVTYWNGMQFKLTEV